jgi:hypothetical protein
MSHFTVYNVINPIKELKAREWDLGSVRRNSTLEVYKLNRSGHWDQTRSGPENFPNFRW